MFDTFFDRAKDLAITAVVGFILAIVGVGVLSVAAAWQLSLWMTWPAALAVTGVGILAIAAISLWIGTAILLTPTGSMANPAVTFGHMFTDSFTTAGVSAVGPFIGIQLVGAVIVAVFANFVSPKK